jgi:hypothetical protein
LGGKYWVKNFAGVWGNGSKYLNGAQLYGDNMAYSWCLLVVLACRSFGFERTFFFLRLFSYYFFLTFKQPGSKFFQSGPVLHNVTKPKLKKGANVYET